MRRIRRALGQVMVSLTLGLAAGAFIEVPVLVALLFGLLGTRAAWRRRAREMALRFDSVSQARRAA
jgi:hypothetical protein